MLLAALSMAVGTVMIRFVCLHADLVTATGWHTGWIALPSFSCWCGIAAVGESRPKWMALGIVFGSAIACLFFYFASSGSLTSLSSLTFLTPVFALLFGNLFLCEFLSPRWVGFA